MASESPMAEVQRVLGDAAYAPYVRKSTLHYLLDVISGLEQRVVELQKQVDGQSAQT